MVKKVLLIFRTVRYLKLRQVIFQFYSRLKPVKNLQAFDYNQHSRLIFQPLHFIYNYIVTEMVKEDLSFNFLNQAYRFSKSIDWDYQGYGKLWNYNLQYFNYLHQANLDNNTKNDLLKEIGYCLRKGTLKLEPYPVSLRAMNAIRYCSVNNINDQQIIDDIYAQLNYLNHNIEYHLLGNHLLENAFALMMGGHTFNEKSWLQKSRKILYRELNEQILNDGGHFELSPMYHQIILFRVLELIDWYRKTDYPDTEFLAFIIQKAKLMLGWLKGVTFENGDIPHFNDSATGVALSSQKLFEYARLLECNNFTSGNFNVSGYRKFSNGKYECVVDVGPVGPSYQPGHSHADALSFILYYRGRPFLVEAGTSTYQIGEKRNYERSTYAHNTVMIGGKNQSEVWGGFRVGRRANVVIENESSLTLCANHDGYVHNFGVLHKRHFNFDINSINIIDQIGTKNGTAILHFHPDCKVEIIDSNTVIIDQFAKISIIGARQITVGNYEFAKGFNQYEQASELIIDFIGTLETFIVFQ